MKLETGTGSLTGTPTRTGTSFGTRRELVVELKVVLLTELATALQ